MKIKTLSRPAAAPGQAALKQPRNLDPSHHPFERAREYTRALNAVKMERMFAAPFIAQLGAGHVDGVYSIANDPGSLERFASGSGDGVVKVWDLPSRDQVWQTKAHTNIVRGLCWTPERKLVSCATDRTIKVWDPYAATGGSKVVPVSTYLGQGAFTSVTHHRSHPSIAASSSSIYIYDLSRPSSAPTQTLHWPTATDTITSVRFNQSETSILASCSIDRSLILYDLRTSSPLARTILTLACNSLSWNPMEPFNFAAASEDHNIYIFDMRNMDRALNVLKDHVAAVMDVQFSPTGEELVSASYDRTVRLWNRDRGHSRDVYHTKRMQRVFSCAFTQDNKYILSGSDDGNVRLWRANASERSGIKSARQRQKLEYDQALVKRYQHMPEIKRIKRHRHLPKTIKKAAEIKTQEIKAIKRRQENVRKHSGKDKPKRRSEREKMGNDPDVILMSLLATFLSDITTSLRNKNGHRVAELIHLDVERLPPDRQQPYVLLNAELNSQYPKHNDEALSERCRSAVPDGEFSTFTAPFSECLVRYFRYLRDFTSSDNLTRALEIRSLTSQCVIALGDSRYGIVMIPIVLSFSRTLAVIAANLDRKPGLVRQRISLESSSEDSNVTFVEATANVLREAFIKCLAGSPGTPRLSRPTPSDKRIGIYLTANSTLALLNRSGKLRSATQIFNSIEAQSPPLSFYPAAQRITYLYYLGRYHFANNHFLRAAIVLESAYRQCHPSFISHRRLILIPLITANLTLGRLPSLQLLTRPECATFGHIFLQLISILKSGDIGGFHAFLDLPPPPQSPAPHTAFLIKHRILLPLRNRLEPLVYRSLIRSTFRMAGYIPPTDGVEAKKIPFLYLSSVRQAAIFSFSRIPSHYYATIMDYVHPDLADLGPTLIQMGFDLASGTYSSQEATGAETEIADPFPPRRRLQPGDRPDQQDQSTFPTIWTIENTFLSLIHQGLLAGFVSHGAAAEGRQRWAIAGAKARGGALSAGFPVIYTAIIDRASKLADDVDQIPGWVKDDQLRRAAGGGGNNNAGGGRVVKLSNARPAGA
ncbi:hypothetical protein DV738_g5642, partial [Chaetothyriales sp. CBS 135597]